jgi:amino acid transporter
MTPPPVTEVKSPRRMSLLQAVSLNMSMMVGTGIFITLPALMDTLKGPQAMIGWILGGLIALADGMVWSELAAAFPGSGGTYHFYDAAFGRARLGRILKFLFVWQFFFSGPLEIATGAIGMVKYLGYFVPILRLPAWNWGQIVPGVDAPVACGQVGAMGVMVLVTALAYRRISVAARLMVVLWVGMLVTVVLIIVAGFTHWSASLAFDFPEGAFHVDGRTAMGLGMALSIAMYNYFGYYQVCYLADEVAAPSRTIPRSILISVVLVVSMYLAMNVAIVGAIPWRAVINSHHVASDLVLQVYGSWAARLATLLIVWTAFASVFAAMLGYSRIPFAAARAGDFFKAFARLHPVGEFPHRSLVLIGGLAALACLAELGTVIDALVAARIPIQFLGQIITVFYLRSKWKGAPATFRMPFYPLPAAVALGGWLFVFWTSKPVVILYSLGSLAAGAAAFFIWDQAARRLDRRSDSDGSLASGTSTD